MTHGKLLYTIGACLIVLFGQSCGPERRLHRILTNNPHLSEIRSKDSTVIRTYQTFDTTYLFAQKTDTIRTEHFEFFRTDSTIRIRGGCPACTTQVIQPTKLIQTSKTREIEINRFTLREWLIGFAGPLIMLIVLSLFNARRKRPE
jgi:hypothetical protein